MVPAAPRPGPSERLTSPDVHSLGSACGATLSRCPLAGFGDGDGDDVVVGLVVGGGEELVVGLGDVVAAEVGCDPLDGWPDSPQPAANTATNASTPRPRKPERHAGR